MEYRIVISGLTDRLTIAQTEDIIGDVKMYLDDEQITYEDVYIQQVEQT